MTSPHKKQNKTKAKNKNKTKTKQNKNKQTNKQTNKNTFSLIFILPETIGIFIAIDIDYNRRGSSRGVLKLELGTDVRPIVLTTTL